MALPIPMDLCDVEEIHKIIDAVADRAMFEEFTFLVDSGTVERDYSPSVTDASMTSASDSQSERTRPTTMDHSEVTSDAPSPSSDQDDMMQETGANANSRHHPTRAGAQSGLDLLIPVLSDKHKERTVVDRPATLPPSGGLVAKNSPVHLRASRALAPRPGPHSAAITSWSHGSPPRTDVPPGRAGRSRIVHDPKTTAAVRKLGSCQHCAVLKRKCDDNDLCARCGKWSSKQGPSAHHARVCIRTRPDEILQSGRGSILDGRWTPERSQQSISVHQGPGLGHPIVITVYFSPSDTRGLQIPIAMHADRTVRIAPDCSAYEAEIFKWAENDLGMPSVGSFQRAVEAFLHLYAQRNCMEKKSLVDSAVRMGSLWRLISANELWHTRFGEHERRPLPASVAAQLKHFARCKMSSAEDRAIDEICAIIPTAFTKENTETPAVWGSLWAVILVYRQAIRMAAGNPEGFKNGFSEVTSRLLDALIVALIDHFRTRKVQDALDRGCQVSFKRNQDVSVAYEHARRERHIIYDEVHVSTCHGDDLLDVHLVKNEHQVMGRKRPKGGKQRPVAELNVVFS